MKDVSQCAYRAVYAYRVPDGRAHANAPAVIGKYMVPNLEYGWPDGPKVYTRKEPGYSALFHKSGEFSIDARAERQWDVDGIEVIQFIDKETNHSFLILRSQWRGARRPDDHGAGLQAYVRYDQFVEYDWVVYDDDNYTTEVFDLPPPPRRAWVPLKAPGAPPAEAPSPQLSLIP